MLSLVRGDEAALSTPGQDPRQADAVFHGDLSQSTDWSFDVGLGSLLVGAPSLSTLYSVDFRVVGDEVALSDSLFGQITGEGRFGASQARLGSALWVGAPDRDVGRGRPKAGAALLFEDLGTGWTGDRTAEDADFVLLGEEPYQHLGDRVAVCSDLDGDGVEDLLVSAAWDHTGARLGGRVFAVMSSEREEREVVVGGLDLSWWSTDEGAQLGRSLACRDLDGDGVDEVLLGAPFADGEAGDATGAIYLLRAPWVGGEVQEAAALVIEGFTAQSYLGWSLALGDLDADGEMELVAGAPGADGGHGAVGIWTSEGALRTLYQGTESGRLGTAVLVLDHDGDGVDDLAMSSPASQAVFLWPGAVDLDWSRVHQDTSAPSSLVGGEGLGRTLAGGDLDGDGDDELLLSRLQ